MESQQSDDKLQELSWAESPNNPKNIATWRKWVMVAIVSLSSLCITYTSSIYSATYGQITVQFGVSKIAATVGLSVFIFGMGLGPMFVAPLSEFYGRRPIYLVTYVLFTIWLIPCAVADNLATMIAGRLLSGLASAAFQSVAGGTISDLFTYETLQLPMMVYSATAFAGPVLGPLVGGFINYHISWRWSFYILIIWSALLGLSCIFFMPETYAPYLQQQQQTKHPKSPVTTVPSAKNETSMNATLLKSMYRPFLLLTLEPMCLCLCIYTSLMHGTLYLFFGAFPLVFSTTYGFNLWQIGLTFLGQLAGTLIGVSLDPLWSWNLRRLIRNYKTAHPEADPESNNKSSKPQTFPAEYRLVPAIFGAPLITTGLFWFGWSCYSDVHWIMPVIGSTFFGIGVFSAFQSILTFLVDAYPLYAASALAANAFLRSSFAAAFPLFGVQMYETLGYHWATSLVAFLTVVMLPFPYIFYRCGGRIRARSRFAAASVE
ncbi:efflux pump antibiotic resistance protein [Aspergillus karnatakaensis]|uniref:MFS transporter n=1 Tax=Aspergillus karnatakaensis TaxID=1810916 RepID=UPI003CCD68BF